jgi:hypothetical protein
MREINVRVINKPAPGKNLSTSGNDIRTSWQRLWIGNATLEEVFKILFTICWPKIRPLVLGMPGMFGRPRTFWRLDAQNLQSARTFLCRRTHALAAQIVHNAIYVPSQVIAIPAEDKIAAHVGGDVAGPQVKHGFAFMLDIGNRASLAIE